MSGIVRLTTPRVNLKTILLAVVVFVLSSGFLCFNVYMFQLHKSSLRMHASSKDELWLAPNQRIAEQFSEITGKQFSEPTAITPENFPNRMQPNNSTDGTNKDCSAFNNFGFQPTTNYRSSNTLPQWMKDYFDWHREQTSQINECNYMEYRFLSLRCSNKERKCGGIADRLKSLPFFIAAAAHSKRILLIRWERPAKLEEFLLPNEINWVTPDWLPVEEPIFIPTGKRIQRGLRKYPHIVLIEGLVQDFYGASSAYHWYDATMDTEKTYDEVHAKKMSDFAGWPDYEHIFRDLFFSVFRPTPPIAQLVKEKMELKGLVPGSFAASQYRAFYAIENQKDQRTEEALKTKAENALNCASKLQPGKPIFFASDSKVAVVFARQMDQDYINRHVVTFDDEKEALHLDKRDQWKSGNVSDFYATFVDLLIMAEARCMSHGVGGYGRFANILSIDPKCVIRHDNERIREIKKCRWYDEKPNAEDW